MSSASSGVPGKRKKLRCRNSGCSICRPRKAPDFGMRVKERMRPSDRRRLQDDSTQDNGPRARTREPSMRRGIDMANRSVGLATNQPIVFINDRNELLCPRCGGGNLHHGLIEAHERNEDSGPGVKVVIDGTHLQAYPVPANDMPWRRNQLVITFRCEGCEECSSLEIRQHKGSTIVQWVES